MNTALIIDGNWLMMSRLFAVKRYFNMQNPEEMRKEGTVELEDLLCKSINLVINKYSSIIDNIIIVGDGGSWRKRIPKPKCYTEEYKGNRVKDAELDWNCIYQALNNIMEQAKNLGITVSKASNIEGDDWVFHWSRYLNNKGINCIIWSSDCDLKQLVQVDNGAFTAWLNESQKGGLPGLVLHKDLNDTQLSLEDIFMQVDRSNTTLDELKTLVQAVSYIDPQDIIETKVICGDKGDNIKPLVQVEKNGKKRNTTEKMWLEVKESLGIDTLDKFLRSRDAICEAVCEKMKSQGQVSFLDAQEMFWYNNILVKLDEESIPVDIQKTMDEVEYKKCDISYIKSNYKTLMLSKPIEHSVEDIFDSMPF